MLVEKVAELYEKMLTTNILGLLRETLTEECANDLVVE